MANEKTVIVADEIISQQTNSSGEPMIHLMKDDVVEFKESEIFVTRKIDFSRNPFTIKNAKSFIVNANHPNS